MTRIINGVAYAPDYEEIVGAEAGSGQHPVVTKVVRPGDVNFSSETERPQGRRAAEPAATTGQTKAQEPARSAEQLPGTDSGH